MKKILLLILVIITSLPLHAGTVTGNVYTSGGQPIASGTLSFTLTQQAVKTDGTGTVATSPTACYTASDGSVVGAPNPLLAPVVSTTTLSGTIPAATYYVRLNYITASGQTLLSPESTVVLSGTGSLIVSAPAVQPAAATAYDVWIGTTSGQSSSLTLITSASVSANATATALSNVSNAPVTNSTSCTLLFNDTLTPSYTAYSVNLVNKAGSQVSGWPQTVYLAGTTVNIASLPPYGNLAARFPTAIISQPNAQALQSILGGLSVTGASSFSNLNGIRWSNGFASIAAALADAGSTGGLAIPPSAPAGGFTNTNSVSVMDFRGGAKSGPTFAVSVKNFGAVGDGSTDDTAAFNGAITFCQGLTALCSIKVPAGTYKVTSQLTLTKAVSWEAEGKGLAYIEGVGLSAGQAVMKYNCSSGARCGGVVLKGLTFYSTNGSPDGLQVTWVLNSYFEDLFFSGLTNGLVSTNSFVNVVIHPNTQAISNDSFQLNDASHQWAFYGGSIGSAAKGIEVTGGVEGLLLDGVDCETTSGVGNCVLLAPTTGKLVNAVTIRNMHTENLSGAAVRTFGADAKSVQGLTIEGSFLDGGRYTQPNAGAQYALDLRNVTSFKVSNNYFWDWELAAIFRNGTESQGTVTDNWMLVQPTKTPMTLFSATPSSSVVQRNNRTQVSGSTDLPAGRQEIYVSSIPVSGTFNPGDIAWNTAPTATSPLGWVNTSAGTPGTWTAMAKVLVASLSTAAATTDNVTVTGATSSSHCSITPTNASAATNVATTYISSKTTDQVTVTHTATGSMTYDLLCTPN